MIWQILAAIGGGVLVVAVVAVIVLMIAAAIAEIKHPYLTGEEEE